MTYRDRSLIAGATDYTGVSMGAILSHVRGWRDSTANTIKTLQRLRGQVETHKDRLDWPAEILNFLDLFIDLFGRYLSDFERLARELPHNVSDAHIQIVRQIYDSSSLEERLCVNFKKEHIERSLKDESLRGLVDRIYAESRDTLIDYRDLSNLEPRLRTFIGTASRLTVELDADRRFALMAIEEARKSIPEDGRVHPRVGAVVVKNGVVLSKAHRGEKLKCHAEYIALENKLPDDLIAGATVYTTLEPCTTRRHPKVPCAQRLIDRKVTRVVIGMLDPNPEIRGLGDQFLSDAGIETQLFPRDLRALAEEMNREFIRAQKERQPSTNSKRRADSGAIMTAARTLCDATRDLQKAAWSFHALHTQYGVVRAVREIVDEEKQILKDIGLAIRVFTQDYDLPADLVATVQSEQETINLALANLKAFSMTGQGSDMELSATQIQEACERIRTAAKPYAYRPSR